MAITSSNLEIYSKLVSLWKQGLCWSVYVINVQCHELAEGFLHRKHAFI